MRALSLTGQEFCVERNQVCHWDMKATVTQKVINEWVWLTFNNTIYLKKTSSG